ncbi:MerR family DNA-binding transcriptional regulator [Nostoc favosum]|uniref:MerR family DNA-binding transcriptional regulator n=1 Tax=Nostoc favosum CHAB5714 TaxID=2780399 RepID=A0ABS8ICC9_9NOSO|nr:MerR family DNA-binding transcriptional regulator [Nostoc favosum]MCC5601177.1 MerR family DNA-binding transcriptional regulator [Nostoc favosum CHAB5714]
MTKDLTIEQVAALTNLSVHTLRYYERIGDVQSKAMTLWWLGHLTEQQGEYPSSVTLRKIFPFLNSRAFV